MGTDEIHSLEGQWLSGLLTADQFEGRDLADVACVDHGETPATDGHRVDAVPEYHVFDRDVVVHEIRGTKDTRAEAHPLDRSLDAKLASEVRHVRVEIAMDHREINDPFDPGLSREVERDERLSEFVGNDGIQKKQCRHARERGTQ